MRRFVRMGLLGLCTGLLSIPALADGPQQVRVAVDGISGQLGKAAMALTYEVNGQIFKSAVSSDGTVLLDTFGADRITIRVDGMRPVEVTLDADSSHLLIDPQAGVGKVVDPGSLGDIVRATGTPLNAADAVTAVAEFAPAEARLSLASLLGQPSTALRGGTAGTDDCASAEAISGEGIFDFDNTNATSVGPNHPECLAFGFDGIANDVWFEWTAPATANYRLETCSLTTIDTKVAAYDGCPTDGGAILACNDDDCALQSGIDFAATGGSTYLLRIGTWETASGGIGQFSITADGTPPPPQDGTGSDDCATADAISGEGTFDFDNTVATSVGPNHPECLAFGFDGVANDVWFEWTAPSSGIFNMQTCGLTTVDTKIAAYDGCPSDGGAILACNDDDCGLQSSIDFTAVGGSTYLLRVGTFATAAGGTGQFTISGDGTPPPTGDGGDDDCEKAEAIKGEGTFNFDNTVATSAGPNHPECDAFGFDGIANDVWFCWTAPADGDYTLETCGLTTVDTKVAVYDGCACGNLSSSILACNDDTCGLQSSVTFSATGGNSYLIRVGTFATAAGGTGQFTIAGAMDPPPGGSCDQPAENCQINNPADALNSTTSIFTVAEDFVVTADGSISGLCWFGAYFDGFGDCSGSVSDSYTVTYYNDDNGFPGTVLASFSQGAGLTVSAPGATGNSLAGVVPEYVLTASHDPVAVTANTCYWLEVSNDLTGCSFFWSISDDGNGRLLQDGDGTNPPNGYDLLDEVANNVAFCLDLELGDPNCTAPPIETPCNLPDENCQVSDTINALTSTAGIFTVADDFETPSSRAMLSEVCWTGGSQDGAGASCGGDGVDNFTIRYFEDNAGSPGSVIATYSQSDGSLTVLQGPTGQLIAGVLPEIEYTGSHAPLALGDGACYWIEITNDVAGCTWFWGTSADGNGTAFQDGDGFVPPDGYDAIDRIVGDLSFCLNTGLGDAGNCLPPGPSNDECENAEEILCNSTATVDNTFATTAASDPNFSCIFGGPGQGSGTVWYTFTATDTSAQVDTNLSGGGDTVIAIYEGVCGQLVELACSEDEGDGLLSIVCVEGLNVGQTYYIQVASFSSADQGIITTQVQCPCPAPPEPPMNDDCEDAEQIGVPSLTSGDTTLATLDVAPDCGTSVTSPGVWYVVEGTGNTMTASMCTGATGFDSKLSVYCADCATLPCVGANDDTCGLQSEVTWCSQAGASYLILVHGFGGAVGSFELEVTDDGVACTADVSCLPAGACCLSDGSCEILTEAECDDRGGAFAGEGTDCGGLEYSLADCSNPFEDISSTGTIATLASTSDDDGDANVPIGFDFEFFGSTYSTIGIASNGYLTFDGTLGDFSNDPIPGAATPNNMIAPLWDDLSPNADPNANVYYETRGSAPNREFIVQWTNVPQFSNTDQNTFQVILSEGSNAIEFRYAAVTLEGFAGDYSIGIENADGSAGVAADASAVTNGTCLRFDANVTESPCGVTLELDMLPGTCPNIITRPLGQLPRIIRGALLGTDDFDVTEINASTVTIERVDGSGFVVPLFSSSIGDVATPFEDDGCNCHDLDGDGNDDLEINFSRQPFRQGIALLAAPLGSDIELVVRGELNDGTPFTAYDCIRRVQPGDPTGMDPLGLPATDVGGAVEQADVRLP